jgi:hypothetical protein
VGPEHSEVEERKDADRIVATNGRDDRAYGRVGERFHQVLRSGLWIGCEPRGVAQRVMGLHNATAKGLLELPFSSQVAMRVCTGASPGERDGGDGVATAQARGCEGGTQPWHRPLPSRAKASRIPPRRKRGFRLKSLLRPVPKSVSYSAT